MKDDKIVGWFTLENGQHVPLREGESKREATQKYLSKKMSRVEKNKSKYDKIDDFKRKKKSNNKIDNKDEEIEVLDLDDKKQDDKPRKNPNARVTGFVEDGSTYYPIREGEGTTQLDKQREDDYIDLIRRKISSDVQIGAGHGDIGKHILINEELENSLKDAVSKDASNEKIKQIINDFREKKMSNRLRATTSGNSELAKLQQERFDLEQDTIGLSSADFDYSDDKYGVLFTNKSTKTSAQQQEYTKKRERIYEIDKRRQEILKTSPRQGMPNETFENHVMKPFKSEENLVKELDRQRVGNENIFATADRFAKSGHYLNNYQDIEDYLTKKLNVNLTGKVTEENYYHAYMSRIAKELARIYNKNK